MQASAPLEDFAYKSSGEMLMAIVGGKVLMALADAPPVFGHLRAGKVRVLAVEMTENLRLSDGRERLGGLSGNPGGGAEAFTRLISMERTRRAAIAREANIKFD